MSSELITICCVLKSGGDYSPIYVKNLHEQIRRNCPFPFRFICFTDFELEDDIDVPLFYNYPGWWSKLEIFRLPGPTIYFDLDTIIINPFEFDLYEFLNNENFYMMGGFNPNRKFASGIMAWNGDFSFILDDYDGKANVKEWDQFHIINAVGEENIKFFPGEKTIYSYKHHCQDGLPNDANIVCFHGKPRPHEIKEGWVLEYWKDK